MLCYASPAKCSRSVGISRHLRKRRCSSFPLVAIELRTFPSSYNPESVLLGNEIVTITLSGPWNQSSAQRIRADLKMQKKTWIRLEEPWNSCVQLRPTNAPPEVACSYISFFFADPHILQRIGLSSWRYFAYWKDSDSASAWKKAGYRIACVVFPRKSSNKRSHFAKPVAGFYDTTTQETKFSSAEPFNSKSIGLFFYLSFLFFTFWQRSVVILLRKKDWGGFDASFKWVLDALLQGF